MAVTPEEFTTRFPGLAERLGPDDLDVLLGLLEVEVAAPGEALIAEGTLSDALYLVWEGELDVSVATPTGEHDAGTVGIGSLLGEVSLLDPGPATASVVTSAGCTALKLTRSRLDELCEESPALAAAVLAEVNHTLANRLAAAVSQLDAVMRRPTPTPSSPPSDDLVAVQSALHTSEQGG